MSRTRRLLGEWQPIVVLAHEALTGHDGAAYEQAAARAAFGELGLRRVVLRLDQGRVAVGADDVQVALDPLSAVGSPRPMRHAA